MTHEAGKGDKQRPTNHEAFSKAWDLIKWSKDAPVSEHPKPADNAHPMDEKH
jgi:hypothetical protein